MQRLRDPCLIFQEAGAEHAVAAVLGLRYGVVVDHPDGRTAIYEWARRPSGWPRLGGARMTPPSSAASFAPRS